MENGFEKIRLRLPALVLLALTVLFWSFYDRYEPDGPVLLSAPTLADGTNVRGEVSASDGRFTLRVPKGGKSARIDFTMPDASHYGILRAHVRIKVEGVVEGKYAWSCARMLVAQYDAKNKWIAGHHALISAEGSSDWISDQDEFEIQPTAARVAVILEQTGAEGTVEFDQIEVRPVRIRASFVRWRVAFAVAWIGMAFLYIPRCRLDSRKLRHLILLNALVILFGALMPSDWIEEGSDWAKKTWVKHTAAPKRATPASPATSAPRKQAPKKDRDTLQMDRFNQLVGGTHRMGHFTLFATLCFLVYLSAALEHQHPAYFFKVGADVLLFAAITESLQFLTIDRTAGICDLRTDFYGMVTALLLFVLLFPLIRHFAR